MLNARLGLQTSSQNCFFLGCFLGRVQYCDLVENRIEYGSSSLPDMVLQNSSQSWCTWVRALRHRPCSITDKLVPEFDYINNLSECSISSQSPLISQVKLIWYQISDIISRYIAALFHSVKFWMPWMTCQWQCNATRHDESNQTTKPAQIGVAKAPWLRLKSADFAVQHS